MRPDKDDYFMQMANLVATRSTCLRRAVGCVLVSRRGHVLATGYNGVSAGAPHCNEVVQEGRDYKSIGKGVMMPQRMVDAYPHACEGASSPSGTNLDGCEAIHAEQNALLQCRDPFGIHTCYVTTMPCMTCTKLLLGTDCERIVYRDPYQPAALELWLSRGRLADHFIAVPGGSGRQAVGLASPTG